MISTSPIKISCMIARDRIPEAVRGLHAAFALEREPAPSIAPKQDPQRILARSRLRRGRSLKAPLRGATASRLRQASARRTPARMDEHCGLARADHRGRLARRRSVVVRWLLRRRLRRLGAPARRDGPRGRRPAADDLQLPRRLIVAIVAAIGALERALDLPADRRDRPRAARVERGARVVRRPGAEHPAREPRRRACSSRSRSPCGSATASRSVTRPASSSRST